MNAIRDLMARIWAVLWVRSQLIRERLPGHRRASGPDYQLAEHEMPRAGIDYEPAEIPAYVEERLEIASADLIGRADRSLVRRRRSRARRRGRAVVVAASALLGLAVMGAGASALIGSSTGVPEVDRLLGLEKQVEQKAQESGTSDPVGPRSPEIGGESVSIEAATTTGTLIGTSYVSRGGEVCSVLVTAGAASAGVAACAPPEAVEEGLSDRDVFLSQIAPGEPTALSGFVTGDVRSVAINGPEGRLGVSLSGLWSPDIGGLPTLRKFIAVVPAGAAPDPRELQQAMDPANYEFVLR